MCSLFIDNKTWIYLTGGRLVAKSETTNKYKRKRNIFIALTVAIVLASVLYIYNHNKEFLYAGTLDATKVDLSSELPSRIAAINVQEGDHTQTGQKLITLSCENYLVDAKLANRNYIRNINLFKIEAIRDDTLDLFANQKANADIHVDWCTIRSPIQGTVLSRYHEPGEYASPGLKILTLANIKDIWAYIYVPQPKIAQLKIGMEIKGILPELENRVFTGKIIKINSEAEFTPKNVQTQSERTRLIFGVKVSFLGSNEDEILKPGMTIEIHLPKD